MNMPTRIQGTTETLKLRLSFIKWQCRVRQIAMRESGGRPDGSIMPEVKLANDGFSLGAVITLIHKLPEFSVTSELQHMAKKTFDLSHKREQAIQFLSSTYYQKHAEFSDILTATFKPNSTGAARIAASECCTLIFDAFNQKYEIDCRVWILGCEDPLHQSTIAHNILFNPLIHPKTIVMAFQPNWATSSSSNSFA